MVQSIGECKVSGIPKYTYSQSKKIQVTGMANSLVENPTNGRFTKILSTVTQNAYDFGEMYEALNCAPIVLCE